MLRAQSIGIVCLSEYPVQLCAERIQKRFQKPILGDPSDLIVKSDVRITELILLAGFRRCMRTIQTAAQSAQGCFRDALGGAPRRQRLQGLAHIKEFLHVGTRQHFDDDTATRDDLNKSFRLKHAQSLTNRYA
ncbi:hypothetical protein FIV07_28555 (plasmid) [Mycobacterium sp. THAF192]|nr:hypothetical protein FIV07_28555 [Mycobacterium sp. THAF192]